MARPCRSIKSDRGSFLIRKNFQILTGAWSRVLLCCSQRDPVRIRPLHRQTCLLFGAGKGPLMLSKCACTFGIGGVFLPQVLPCGFKSLKCMSADPKALQVSHLELNRTAWSLTGTSNHFQSSDEKLVLKRMWSPTCKTKIWWKIIQTTKWATTFLTCHRESKQQVETQLNDIFLPIILLIKYSPLRWVKL